MVSTRGREELGLSDTVTHDPRLDNLWFLSQTDAAQEAWERHCLYHDLFVVWDSTCNVEVCVFPLCQQLADTSTVSKNSTQLWHRLPRDSIWLYRLKVHSDRTAASLAHTPEASGKPRSLPVLLINQPQTRHSLTQDASHKSRLLPKILTNWL